MYLKNIVPPWGHFCPELGIFCPQIVVKVCWILLKIMSLSYLVVWCCFTPPKKKVVVTASGHLTPNKYAELRLATFIFWNLIYSSLWDVNISLSLLSNLRSKISIIELSLIILLRMECRTNFGGGTKVLAAERGVWRMNESFGGAMKVLAVPPIELL